MQLYHVLDFKDRPNEVVTIAPGDSIRAAVRSLCEHHIGALPVVDPQSGVLVGIVTERDVLNKWCDCCGVGADSPISGIMTAEVTVGRPTDRVLDCLRLMSEKRIRHLPVVDNGRLLGIVSIGDLLRALYQEHEIHLRHLAEYLAGTYDSRVY